MTDRLVDVGMRLPLLISPPVIAILFAHAFLYSLPYANAAVTVEVRPGEIRLDGTIEKIEEGGGSLVLRVTSFTLPNGRTGKLSTPKLKSVTVTPNTVIRFATNSETIVLDSIKPGARAAVIGDDLGTGSILPGREIIVHPLKTAVITPIEPGHGEREPINPGIAVPDVPEVKALRREQEQGPSLEEPPSLVVNRTTRFNTRETPLGSIHSRMTGAFFVSPDSRHVAYLSAEEQGITAVIDGMRGEEYQEIADRPGIVFGQNGQHVAYIARRDDRWHVIHDGVAGEGFDEISQLVFSPDGKRLAYIARKGRHWTTVVDGTQGDVFDDVRTIFFNRDGSSVAHRAKRDGKWSVVVDGRQSSLWDSVDSPAFSPTGQRIVYAARRGGKWRVVVDEAESKPYDRVIRDASFSPDGKRVAFAVREGDVERVVIDGQAGKSYTTIVSDVIFSPDSKRVAYVAGGTDQKQMVVIDGKEGRPYRKVTSLIFSPDGRRYAYVAMREDFKDTVVVDGREGKSYREVRALQFSPNSKRIAYVASPDVSNSPAKHIVVVDGVDGKAYEGIWQNRIWFSADSKHLVTIAITSSPSRKGTQKIVVMDGKEGKPYDQIRSPVISPDGKLAYLAKRAGETKFFCVIDGVEGDEYNVFLGPLVFDGSKSLRGLALQNDKLIRIELDVDHSTSGTPMDTNE